MEEHYIPKSAIADAFGALGVTMLLLLTAWGNASAMFVVSLLGLVIMVVMLPGQTKRDAMLVAAIGGIVAFATILILQLFR